MNQFLLNQAWKGAPSWVSSSLASSSVVAVVQMQMSIPRILSLSYSISGKINYAFGLKEQLIFPEIEYDKVDKIRGMNICICTTATTDEEAKELLTQLGAPFTA